MNTILSTNRDQAFWELTWKMLNARGDMLKGDRALAALKALRS